MMTSLTDYELGIILLRLWSDMHNDTIPTVLLWIINYYKCNNHVERYQNATDLL